MFSATPPEPPPDPIVIIFAIMAICGGAVGFAIGIGVMLLLHL